MPAHRKGITAPQSIACLVSCLVLWMFFTCEAMCAKGSARTQPADDKQLYSTLQLAERAITEQNFAEGKRILANAAAHDPSQYSGNIHYNLAVCYRGLKDYTSALEEARKALTFTPTDSESVLLSALIYQDMSDFERCLEFVQKYKKVIEGSPVDHGGESQKNQFVYTNLKAAKSLIEQKKLNEAIQRLRIAGAFDPSQYTASIHETLSYTLRRVGKLDEALLEGNLALGQGNQASRDPNLIYNIACIYEGMGRFDDAISYLKEYMEMKIDSDDRDNAADFIKCLYVDKKNAEAGTSATPDYFDFMRKSGSQMWAPVNIPLKIFVPAAGSVRGYKSEFNSFITDSLDQWCKSSGKKLDYRIVNDRSSCDIEIVWTDKRLGENASSGSMTTGRTHTRTIAGFMLAPIKVEIMTVDPFDLSKPVEPGECASTCLHEVGHALGIDHSQCISDVMYFRTNNQQTGILSSRDAATIRRLYAKYPVTAFKPLNLSSPTTVYLTPPSFKPPKLPKTPSPPLFVPPPLLKKAAPPFFMPPPLPQPEKIRDGTPQVPFFVPPPIDSN